MVSCEKEDDRDITDDKDTTSENSIDNSENIAISEWIYEWMHDVYYWNNTFPSIINIEEKIDPGAFFYELVYEPEDKWSYITDDYETLESEFSGTPVSMGYSPAFGLFSNSNRVFIIVEYIYPDSPAEDAGLKRGDIILTINGEYIDTANYYELYSQVSYTVSLGVYSNNTIYESGKTITMTAAAIDANPLIYDTVFEISGTKIGYMVYTEFISGTNNEYLETLKAVFDEFKSNGITDLIVDLRYNPGGEIDVSGYMASAIAPASVVNNSNIFIKFHYNDLIQSYYEYTEGTESENLVYKFPYNSHNIDLNRVYFLTSYYTASASELLIVGLKPYMDVTIIGEQTYGKYTGAWLIYDFDEPPQHNWAIVPIVLKYANAEGYTDFADGLTPDYEIEDNLINAKPFGDTDDPMLALAIENITGVTLKSVKKEYTGKEFLYKRLDSKLDIMKRNLIVPNNTSSLMK